MANLDPGLIARFNEKFIPEPNSGCWIWLASTNQGYGVIKVGGRYKPAHRVSFLIAGGSIPEGLVLDHKCRNTACVNPAHLEPTTIGENIRRGDNHYRSATNCKRGHQFTPENTLLLATGSRACRACARLRMKSFKEKKNGA